jgi:hypothetical protein
MTKATAILFITSRNGVAEIFMEVEPLAGKRHITVTEHRTRKDWAMQIKQMLDGRYPSAVKIRLVMDNLNTHSIASLYEAFEPEEARRLIKEVGIGELNLKLAVDNNAGDILKSPAHDLSSKARNIEPTISKRLPGNRWETSLSMTKVSAL